MRYVLVDADAGTTLVAAEEIRGFFVARADPAPDVVFVGVDEAPAAPRRAEHAVLRVENHRRERIGQYYIGRVARRADETPAVVSFRPFPHRCEHEAAAAIWARWASPAPLRAGEWRRWTANGYEDWLHVAGNSWFTLNRPDARLNPEIIADLDGELMPTRSAFYIAVGEAFNGPGGYVGDNRDALADFLSTDDEAGPPARAVWRNFDASERLLGRPFVESILEIAGELGAEISLHRSTD